MTGVKMTLYMLAIPLENCKIILLLRFVTCYNDFIAIQFYLLKKGIRKRMCTFSDITHVFEFC